MQYEGGNFITLGKSTQDDFPIESRSIERTLTISATSNFSNNILSVNYITNLEALSTIEIFNISGQLVKSINVTPSSSKATIEIDCDDLKNGSYYFNVNVSGVTIHTNKFIRLK